MTSYCLLKRRCISFIAIIFCIQYSLACDLQQFQYKSFILIDNYYYIKNKPITVYTESDIVEMHYPNKIQLSGNAHIRYHNNIITADTLVIFNNNNNYTLPITLYAKGNVCYRNKSIILTGSKATFNLNNKNIDVYQGTYYFQKFQIYGTGDCIMQRKNNRYTIIKNTNLSSCEFCNNYYWNILGSKILYDWDKNNMYIWNATFKINKIPIFYYPYLIYSLNQKNILESYIPTIKYNSKYGLTFKTPFPLIFSEYYIGNITPYYGINFGIGLQTKIYYLQKPNTGIISINIIDNNNSNNYDKILYKVHWKHHTIINTKWNIDIDHINHNHLMNNNFNKLNKKYLNNINNHIDQKLLCYYNSKHWKTSLSYLKKSNIYKKNDIQNNCFYSATPKIEIQFYSTPVWKKKIYFQTIGQLSQFTPSNYIYPKTTRIHVEPVINFTRNNSWSKFNINTKLKMTHYQQNNLKFYNKKYKKHHLQNRINRIIPQFQTDTTVFFQKKTNTIESNKYLIESKLQYLYIPYVFQENIGIYDTKKIYINHNNLFHGLKYSGLDRIESANQFTGSITIHCSNKQSELFYLSIGQILNLNPNNSFISNHKHTQNYLYKHTTNSNIKLLSLGSGYWNVNDYLNMQGEMQYDILCNKLSAGNTTLEYMGKKNQIFQFNYRYVNAKCFQKNLFLINNSIHYKTISQLGIIMYYPLTNNWIINYSHYHNIKFNTLIDQTIGIQHSTPCFKYSIIFERNLTNWNNKLHTNSYDNKIQFHINFKPHFQSQSYKFLNSDLIPYQKLH